MPTAPGSHRTASLVHYFERRPEESHVRSYDKGLGNIALRAEPVSSATENIEKQLSRVYIVNRAVEEEDSPKQKPVLGSVSIPDIYLGGQPGTSRSHVAERASIERIKTRRASVLEERPNAYEMAPTSSSSQSAFENLSASQSVSWSEHNIPLASLEVSRQISETGSLDAHESSQIQEHLLEGLVDDPEGLDSDPEGLAGDPEGLDNDPEGLVDDPEDEYENPDCVALSLDPVSNSTVHNGQDESCEDYGDAYRHWDIDATSMFADNPVPLLPSMYGPDNIDIDHYGTAQEDVQDAIVVVEDDGDTFLGEEDPSRIRSIMSWSNGVAESLAEEQHENENPGSVVDSLNPSNDQSNPVSDQWLRQEEGTSGPREGLSFSYDPVQSSTADAPQITFTKPTPQDSNDSRATLGSFWDEEANIGTSSHAGASVSSAAPVPMDLSWRGPSTLKPRQERIKTPTTVPKAKDVRNRGSLVAVLLHYSNRQPPTRIPRARLDSSSPVLSFDFRYTPGHTLAHVPRMRETVPALRRTAARHAAQLPARAGHASHNRSPATPNSSQIRKTAVDGDRKRKDARVLQHDGSSLPLKENKPPVTGRETKSSALRRARLERLGLR